MKRPSIKVSLTVMFSALLFIVVAISAIAMTTMSVMFSNTVAIGEGSLPKIVLVNDVKLNFNLLGLGAARHLLAKTPEDIAADDDFTAKVKSELAESMGKLEALLNTEKDKAIFKDMKDQTGLYLGMLDQQILSVRDAGKFDEATVNLKGNLNALADKTNAIIDQLETLHVDLANSEMAEIEQYHTKTFWTLLGTAFVAVAITLTSIWFALTGISKPIGMITSAMGQLAGGDTQSEIPFGGRSDEIGTMAEAVEVFRQTALSKIEADRLIEANRSQSEKDRIAQELADRERAEAMAKVTTDLGAGLQRLSSGDLSVQLVEPFAADFEALRQDFNSSVNQLAGTLRSVVESIATIASGSEEISSGTNDFSRRTEQQAAALEETAAALDQITVNVSSSSQRTEEARTVALQANQSAQKSGEVVSEAVKAMSRIEDSASQIANIIGVIDEIAFQTNLLALNAGVEAARAGDAGKGFAVVAQEVRELAQRSASAAKEIKGLIQTSTAEVTTGVKLVSETGSALKSIREFIVKINEHMDAIATSSKEQSTGLAEVNTAVNQMDQTTQQNAAMVEESSAAAGTLAGEATNLRNLIGQFELGQTQDSVKALRHTAQQMGGHRTAVPVPAQPRRMAEAASTQSWSEF